MEEILYVKYSNERAPEFSVRTELRESDNGTKIIVKAPISKMSVMHVENMYYSYLKLIELYQNDNVKINKCKYANEIASFEYIEGETLQQIVDKYIKDNQWNKVYEIIDEIVRIISDKATIDFIYTEEFKHIFGNVDGIENSKCSEVTDVDMIFSNIIINEGINIIDYEWTFSFPIPVKFVIFRLCFFLIHQCCVNQCITIEQLMARYSISKEEYNCFIIMEENFQHYIRGNRTTLRECGTSNMTHIRSINDINKIYINNPEGLYVNVYSVDNKQKRKRIVSQNIMADCKFAREFENINNILEVEIECGCGLLVFKTTEFDIINNNGMKIADSIYLYIADKMRFSIADNLIDSIKLDFTVVKLDLDSVSNIKNEIDNLVQDNMRLNEELLKLG